VNHQSATPVVKLAYTPVKTFPQEAPSTEPLDETLEPVHQESLSTEMFYTPVKSKQMANVIKNTGANGEIKII
jgi:hypothetical protein